MNISLADAAVLLGIVQGYILAALVYTDRTKSPLPNRSLAALFFLLSTASLGTFLSGVVPYLPPEEPLNFLLINFPFHVIMPVGPLVFLYVQALMGRPAYEIPSGFRKHFYPAILDVAPFILAVLFLGLLQTGVAGQADFPRVNAFLRQYRAYVDIPRWVSLLLYICFTFRLIRNRRVRGTPGEKVTDRLTYRWAWQFTGSFFAIFLVWTPYLWVYISPYQSTLLRAVFYYPVYIPLMLLIYWLGFKWYRLPAEVKEPHSFNAGRSEFTAGEFERYANRVRTVMETEKLYLDSSLKADTFGRAVGLPEKTVSKVLNQYLHKNFNDFVNEYRINEVKKRLTACSGSHLTIEGIAFECGFNSRATFQRTFRKIAGMSPTEFIASLKSDHPAG